MMLLLFKQFGLFRGSHILVEVSISIRLDHASMMARSIDFVLALSQEPLDIDMFMELPYGFTVNDD